MAGLSRTRGHASPARSAGPASLRVHDLSHSYGGLRALADVTIDVAPGAVCCVLGPNGAGKTTLGAAIAGALVAETGEVHVDGADVSAESQLKRSRRGVAYIPDSGGIFPSLTVTENLCLGLGGLTKRRTREVVEQAASLFGFLGSRRDTRAGMLSGGEQQMLSLAQLLLAKPRIAVIDELSHGLAPAIVDKLMATVAERRGSITFVLIEQYLERAYEVADTLLVLSRGSAAYAGPAKAVSVRDIEEMYTLTQVPG